MKNLVAANLCRELRKNFGDYWREIVEEMQIETDDFTVYECRFIHKSRILDIFVEELESDEYCLGGVNASLISEITGWPIEMVELTQKAEEYELLGAYIIKGNYTKKLAERIALLDGYGTHFNHWDGSGEMYGDYYAFSM